VSVQVSPLVVTLLSPSARTAMYPMYAFARAGTLAYVNGNAYEGLAPNRATPTRLMAGLQYAAGFASQQAAIEHRATTPVA